MTDPLLRLVRALGTLAPDTDATAVAEVLWLAATATGSTPDPTSQAHPPKLRSPAGPPAGEPVPPPALSPPRHPTGTAGYLHHPPPGSTPARPISVPRGEALPRNLETARALRPLKRKRPSASALELDVAATVEAYARTNEILPQFTPTTELWFDALLVIDGSPSMTVWQETASELTTLLRGYGAFRQLRRLTLSFDGPTAELLDHRQEPVEKPPITDGRTLVLVLSDCTDPGWHAPGVWQLLRRHATRVPVALINPMAAGLRQLTGLGGLPAVRVTARRPAAPNTALSFEVPLLLRLRANAAEQWIPLPVIALTPHTFDRWARTVIKGSPDGCDAVLIPEDGRLPEAPRPPRPVPADPIGAFLRTASPYAVRLAELCAPFAWLGLPLIHLLRQVLLPEATLCDVAELLHGPLLVTEGTTAGKAGFTFRDEARARLASRLSRSDAWRTQELVGRYVAAHAGSGRNFEAALSDAQSIAELPSDLQPFAQASADILHLLGAGTRRTVEPVPAAGRGEPAAAVQPVPLSYQMVVGSPHTHASAASEADRQIDIWLSAEGHSTVPADACDGPTRIRLGERILLDRDGGELDHAAGRYTRRRLRLPAPHGYQQLTLTVVGPAAGPVLVRLHAEDLISGPGIRRPARVPVPELAAALLIHLDATDGGAEVHPVPRLVTAAEVTRVVDELCAPERRLPVVVATVPGGVDVQHWLDEVARPLMRQVTGLAIPYVLDRAAQPVFNLALKYHKVYGGAVRTYLPEVDPASRGDATRHPVLPRHRIDEDLRRAAALLAREPRRLAAATVLPDALAAVPVLRLLPAVRPGLLESVSATGAAGPGPTIAVGTVHGTVPASFGELLGRFEEFPLLQFTGDEKETLALDGQPDGAGWARLTWDGLTALQEYAHAAVQGRAGGDFKQWCEHTPAGCHHFPPRKAVRWESRTVESHAKWKRERMLPVPSTVDVTRRAFMGAHLRIGGGSTAPRLHYLDDCSGSGRIYVGYIGQHLTNTRTN
ncbi:hypothetical protein KNE206_61650 [Kitasatospora sp. NE20-6]|uniref:SAV_2336 N-terminal domain-related protein n=1 Tax=Kitasatospora sp. NE20-6 TaxID=2859066 RepID=UPI0034DC2DB3